MRLFKHAKVYPITFITPKEIFLKDECTICLEEINDPKNTKSKLRQ